MGVRERCCQGVLKRVGRSFGDEDVVAGGVRGRNLDDDDVEGEDERVMR